MLHILCQGPEGPTRYTNDPAVLRELMTQTDQTVWVDFERPTPEEYELLTSVFDFHPLAIEDCKADVHHPKVEDYGPYLYLIFHAVVPVNLLQEKLQTQEVDFFLGPRYLVTHHREERPGVDAVRRAYADQAHPLRRGADFVARELMDRLLDEYSDLLDKIGDQVRTVEDTIFKRPSDRTLYHILALKRDLLQLARVMIPQRDVLMRLTRGEFPLIRPEANAYFRDLYDRLYHTVDTAAMYQDILMSGLEAYLSVVSNRMNAVMKILAAITTIFMPLTLITGVYGMNFDPLPGSKGPMGFWLCLAGVLAVGVGVTWTFRRKGWL